MIFRRNAHEKMLKDIEEYIEHLISQNNELKDKLNNYRKEDEIQKLEEENLRLREYSIAIMSDIEMNDTLLFREEHYKKCKGSFVYIVTGTGIGHVIKVQCKKCNEIKNVTDSSNW